jgi:hypothetical protein
VNLVTITSCGYFSDVESTTDYVYCCVELPNIIASEDISPEVKVAEDLSPKLSIKDQD